jgi:hypothetical protein
MFFLLRQLRRLELRKRTGRYFLYAIGEIVLVVVGILIALAINNWNEERKQEKQRRELIESLITDFTTNVERLEESVSLVKRYHADIIEFLKVSAGEIEGLSAGETRALASSTQYQVIFQPAIGSYQMALSTGTIGLLEDELLNELFLQWEQGYSHFQVAKTWGANWALGESLPKLREKLGSVHTLFDLPADKYYLPKIFELSDEEFFRFIGQKEVYGIFESRQWLLRNHETAFTNLKEAAEKILARLKAL